MQRRKVASWRLSHTGALLLALAAIFVLQLLALGAVYQFRVREVENATQSLPISTLLNLQQFLEGLEPEEQELVSNLANMPNLNIYFSDTRPEPVGNTWLARVWNADITAASVRLENGQYITLSRTSVLAESLGFLAQAGLLIVLFFGITAFILIRARAALQPVERFAQAAQRLFNDLHAPPMREDGRAELRQAAQAINRMQISMQELVASRSRMIAGMGHDLRTYITRLTLRAEFIGDEAQRAKALGDLGDMTAVINQALDLGKADHPNEPATPQPLIPFLERIVEAYQDMGDPVTFDPGAQINAPIRPTALTRALQN